MRTNLNKYWTLLCAIDKTSFLHDVECSYFTASHVCNGTKKPSDKLRDKIIEVSGTYGDKLTIEDFTGE